MKKVLSALVLSCAAALCAAARGEVVNVYTSAIAAPLVIGEHGIYPDMVAYLNRQNLKNLSFKLVYLPRKRLQLKVESGDMDGIVIGMMPHWFDDTAQKKYLWTAPFALDHYVVVMRAGQDYNAGPPGALTGRSVGLVLGYNYPDLEDWMRQNQLVRNDAGADDINLDKLLLGRVDCVATVESVVRYYQRNHPAAAQFKLYDLPARPTERRFLVPHARKAVFEQIAPLIRKLKDDSAWQGSAARYQ